MGFNLYVQDANGKHKLNAQLIPSTGFTTHTPQDYHFATSGLVLSGTVTFYLEDMDFLGKTMLHGPFALDAGVWTARYPHLDELAADRGGMQPAQRCLENAARRTR